MATDNGDNRNKPDVIGADAVSARRISWPTLVGIASVIAYAAFVQFVWGWGAIVTAWQGVGFGPLVLSLTGLVVTYLIRAWRMACYFHEETAGGFVRLFRLTQIYNLLNVMLPLRSGEASFPLLMKREFAVSLSRATAGLVVMRLLDLHALLAAGGFALALSLAPSRGDVTAWLAWLIWGLFLLVPFLLYPARRPVFRFIARRMPENGRFRHVLEEVRRGIPDDPARLLQVFAMTLLNWAVKILVLAWILWLLGITHPAGAIGGAFGGELSAILPFHAPAGVGTYPAGIVAGAAFLSGPGLFVDGVALDALAKAAVTAHMLIVVSAFAVAALAMLLAWRMRRH